jgi:site-specific recombinase XerD
MPRKNLPPFVARHREKFRGWAVIGGVRRFGPSRATAAEAHRDALTMRGAGEAMTWGGTLEQRVEEWIAGRQVAADTVTFWRGKLKTVYTVLPPSMPLDRVTPAVLGEFVRAAKDRGLSPRTIQHCRRVLHTFFAWAVRRGLVQASPVAAVDWPRVRETMPDVLNEVELASCLSRITDPWAADLAVFMAYTGLRRAEVARLQVGAVDLGERVLWVEGKARDQAHPLPDDAVAAATRLVEAAGDREHLVPGVSEGARRSKVAETFRLWQRRLKEPRWHPHTLRHSVATIMLRRGVSPATVQRFLRHASYAMTQRYVHLVESDLRAATTRLRLLGDDPLSHGLPG